MRAMQSADEIVMKAAPTESGLPFRLADFDTFVEALDYAATGATGMTYYNSKGEVIDLLPYADLAVDARNVAARLLAAGLKPGEHVALLAETNADFARTFCGCLYAGLVPAPLPLPVAFGDRAAYNEQLSRIIEVANKKCDAGFLDRCAAFGQGVWLAGKPVFPQGAVAVLVEDVQVPQALF